MDKVSLFDSVYAGIQPFFLSIGKIALFFTLFSLGLRMIRSKGGQSSELYGTLVRAFIGYLMIAGVAVILKITDSIIAQILENM